MPETAQAAVITTGSEPDAEPLSWEEVRRRFAAERWLLAGDNGTR
ncbi:MAG: hypothetical protein ABSA93_13640 [Streptosporangiaceae bacterium]|jgi:hypothetical protein